MINIRESIKFGFAAFKKNWIPFVVLSLAFFVVSQASYSVSGTSFSFFGIPDLISIVAGGIVSFALYGLSLKVVDGKKVKLSDSFENSKLLLPFILVFVTLSVLIQIGFVLLIIPGLILIARSFAAPYLVLDKKQTFTQAIKNSWELTKGKTIKLIFLFITLFVFTILGLLALVVGVLVTFSITTIASAYVYRKISPVSSS